MNNNGYFIVCNEEVKKDILKNNVNWYNFDRDDIYYDNSSTGHHIHVNHKYKTVYFKL